MTDFNVPKPTAWDRLLPEYRSVNEPGWSRAGEFYCTRCDLSMGKNLRGESPHGLVWKHMQEHDVDLK